MQEPREPIEKIRVVIDDMLGRLGQSHFAVIPHEARPDSLPSGVQSDDAAGAIAGGVGLDFRLRDSLLLVTEVSPGSPAAEAGIGRGWSLRDVDGYSIMGAIERLPRSTDRRKVALQLRQRAQHESWGPIGSRVQLTLFDGDNREVRLELERVARNVIAHSFGTTLPTFYLRFDADTHERSGKSFGRVHFTNWFLPMMAPINAAIDAMELLGTQTMRDSELRYVAFPRRIDSKGELVDPFAGSVAILIDETSASASEVFAGGMQSVGRARVFGETSAGAVLPARTTVLPNGDALLHAIGDFKTATGVELETRGVIPDEAIPVTQEDLLAGLDRQLEAALEWLVSQSQY